MIPLIGRNLAGCSRQVLRQQRSYCQKSQDCAARISRLEKQNQDLTRRVKKLEGDAKGNYYLICALIGAVVPLATR